MKEIEIIKKNRKYFSAILYNGYKKYKCKILIDENSSDLEIGEHITLKLDDISVRSNYGTDLIFKLSASANKIEKAGICTLRTKFYNKNLVEKCHKLGGKWDKTENAWIFSGLVEDEVEELDEKYNSTMIATEILFKQKLSAYGAPVFLNGFRIASAYGRDSGSKLSEGVALIKGNIRSGGSIKNWATIIEENTVIRMYIPLNCFDDFDKKIVEVKQLKKNKDIVKENKQLKFNQ